MNEWNRYWWIWFLSIDDDIWIKYIDDMKVKEYECEVSVQWFWF